MSSLFRISIIIPVLNEMAYLPDLIERIHSEPGILPEIIIADAGSTDGSAEYAGSKGCTVVKGGLPGVGRNQGVLAARYERLLFFDADVTFRKGFIRACIRHMKRNGIDVGSVWAWPDCQNLLDHLMFWAWNLWVFMMQKVWPHGAGYCLFSTKTMHEKLGGFNERMHLAEDANYVMRSSRRGTYAMLPYTLTTSNRRLITEGRFGLARKLLGCAFYRLMVGEPEQNEFSYDFGLHDDVVREGAGERREG